MQKWKMQDPKNTGLEIAKRENAGRMTPFITNIVISTKIN